MNLYFRAGNHFPAGADASSCGADFLFRRCHLRRRHFGVDLVLTGAASFTSGTVDFSADASSPAHYGGVLEKAYGPVGVFTAFLTSDAADFGADASSPVPLLRNSPWRHLFPQQRRF